MLLVHCQKQGLNIFKRKKKCRFLSAVCVCSVQFSSVTQLCLTLCDPMNRITPGLLVHHQLMEFTQTHAHESVMPSSHLILCCPLFLLPPILPSIRVFSNESTLCMRWPKYWSFSFSIRPSKEHPGLISSVCVCVYDLLHTENKMSKKNSYQEKKVTILLTK